MVNVDETENEMLECFRNCVSELNYFDDIKTMSIEDLKKFYFDIATPIKQMLNGFGFNMISFGFETPDEISKEDKEFIKNSNVAQFVISYDYNSADPVTAYMPFTTLIANPKWTEAERLNIQRQIVMGFYNGFMSQYAKHHTEDEFNETTKTILTKIGLGTEEINKVITPKE